MAVSFENILQKAERSGQTTDVITRDSLNWFRDNLRKMRNVQPELIIRDNSLIRQNVPRMGYMYMFGYDPKYKETLPYYDTFPLIILAGAAKGGFYGLNLHYLSPFQRARFFDILVNTSLRVNEDNSALNKFMISYSRIVSPGLACWKHYLTEHVKTKIFKVPFEHWQSALFLPTENFMKENKRKAWKDSLKL